MKGEGRTSGDDLGQPQAGLQVTKARTIDVPVGDLWRSISTPGNLEASHPFCSLNSVETWPGPESRDTVHYLNGRVYRRRFSSWADGVGYGLTIEEDGNPRASVQWRVAEVDERRSTLSIAIEPLVLAGAPMTVRRLAHRGYLAPMLTKYLDSVLQGFEWVLTTGQPVSPNQFGRHRWYS